MKAQPWLANWKSTLIGAIYAAAVAAQETGVDLPAWVLPTLIAAFAVVIRDADKSSQDSGIR